MNQRGFALISILIALPLILMLFLSGLWCVWFINEKMAVNNICHHRLLKAQDHLVRGNANLLRFNTLARMLIIQKRTLDAIIIVAPPPAKAAALAQRKVVVAEQRVLRKTQQAIIGLANLMAQKEMIQLQVDYRKKMGEIKQFWQSSQSTPFLAVYPKTSQIEISWRDIAPTYKRKQNHEKAQAMEAQWRIPLKTMMPPWLLKFVPVSQQWLGQCSTHPHQGGRQWVSAIGKGNH